jgi:RNA polymerase sigma-70 factor (ECF subfamily)
MGIAGNREDAEDLTQEAFVRGFNALDSFHEGHSFENWMFRIVQNLFLDLLRKRRRRISSISYDALKEESGWTERPDPSPSPEKMVTDAFLMPEIEQGIAGLRSRDQELLGWHHDEGLSHSEIGEKLNLQSTAVRARIHRAHLSLRKLCSASSKQAATRN